uniref:Glycine-rich protein n=1 Tax=Acrobeloides nanus TaxID=290746 RepID=A0A914CIV4_9BILA
MKLYSLILIFSLLVICSTDKGSDTGKVIVIDGETGSHNTGLKIVDGETGTRAKRYGCYFGQRRKRYGCGGWGYGMSGYGGYGGMSPYGWGWGRK